MTGEPASRPPQVSPQSDLPLRALSAVVMIALALGTAWAGGQAFILFWLLAAFAVHWEWQRLLHAPAFMARLFTGAAGLSIAAAMASGGLGPLALVVVAVFGLLLGFLGKPAMIWSGAGMLYAGALLVAVLVLRSSLLHGFEIILWLFAIVWGTDILAYFCGRGIGGPKLWPRVSPSKTWSGFIGGVVGGAACGTALVLALLPSTRGQAAIMFVLALVLAMISQGGDLFESSVKRRYDVKDSSALIPGHGGAMDRLDGFAAAAICAAIIGMARGGPVNVANGLLEW